MCSTKPSKFVKIKIYSEGVNTGLIDYLIPVKFKEEWKAILSGESLNSRKNKNTSYFFAQIPSLHVKSPGDLL